MSQLKDILQMTEDLNRIPKTSVPQNRESVSEKAQTSDIEPSEMGHISILKTPIVTERAI